MGRKRLAAVHVRLAVALLLLSGVACAPQATTALPTVPPTAIPSAAPSLSPSPTATTAATAAPTIAPTATGTATSTATPDATATATTAPSPTDRPSLCRNGCTTPPPACAIKGNISVNGEKIYHMPGQRYYAETVISPERGERWFCTEAEARANGWRKSMV